MSTLLRLSAFTLVALVACGCDKAGASSAQSASTAPAQAPGPVLGRLVEITATNDGYSPASIDAKAGEQLTLRFTRKTKSECLGEVVFPSLSIKKTLPMDTPVDIAVKPEKAGEIKFSCGMSMVFGKINVS